MIPRILLATVFGITVPSLVLAAPWSPDGTKIVYSYIGGPESLYIANADGSDEHELVVRDQRDFRPEWSPDGSHIIFTSVVDGKHVIMTVKPDGSALTQLTKPEETAGDADYSADGTRLLYFTDEPLPRDLYVRELKTGAVTALTNTPDFQEMSPRWAPDSKRIVFVGKENADGAEGDIWTLDTSSGERKNLTQTPGVSEFHPDWSFDGASVIFIRVENDAFNVVIRNVSSGEEKIAATGNGYAVLSPHFSPDDRYISFTRTDFAEKGEGMPAIVRVSLEDGEETVIAKNLYLSQMK